MGAKVGTCHLLTDIKLMYPGVSVLGKFLVHVCGKVPKYCYTIAVIYCFNACWYGKMIFMTRCFVAAILSWMTCVDYVSVCSVFNESCFSNVEVMLTLKGPVVTVLQLSLIMLLWLSVSILFCICIYFIYFFWLFAVLNCYATIIKFVYILMSSSATQSGNSEYYLY